MFISGKIIDVSCHQLNEDLRNIQEWLHCIKHVPIIIKHIDGYLLPGKTAHGTHNGIEIVCDNVTAIFKKVNLVDNNKIPITFNHFKDSFCRLSLRTLIAIRSAALYSITNQNDQVTNLDKNYLHACTSISEMEISDRFKPPSLKQS